MNIFYELAIASPFTFWLIVIDAFVTGIAITAWADRGFPFPDITSMLKSFIRPKQAGVPSNGHAKTWSMAHKAYRTYNGTNPARSEYMLRWLRKMERSGCFPKSHLELVRLVVKEPKDKRDILREVFASTGLMASRPSPGLAPAFA